MDIDLKDAAETEALGARLAALAEPGDVILLKGDLGAGKTTLVRGFIAALAARAGLPEEEVPSPTFSIVQTYEFGTLAVVHADLYRIESEDEAEELGLEDAFPQAVTLIEWPERVPRWQTRADLTIELDFTEDGRRARLTGRLARAILER